MKNTRYSYATKKLTTYQAYKNFNYAVFFTSYAYRCEM
jgi:hypothetical protein